MEPIQEQYEQGKQNEAGALAFFRSQSKAGKYMISKQRGPPMLFADGSHPTMSHIKDLEKKNCCGSVILFLGNE
jgi:hypothetical protein